MPDLMRWPDWMPKPQQSDYSYELTDRRSRTDMEVGSLIRVNFDTDESSFTCSIILDKFQSAWFEAFEKGTLNQGSLWFQMPLMSSGEINWHTVRFKSRPKANLVGPNHTRYSFVLEAEQRPDVLCPELAGIITCTSPNLFCDAQSLLAYAVNEILPSLQLPDFWLPADTA